MAKRTLNALALLIADMTDKSQSDTTFITFCENMLNLTLQEIISEVPHARWLLEEHSITLTASQQYVTMPSDLDIEGIVSLRDDTNNRSTKRINPGDADLIDPGRDLSGSVLLWWYQRVGGADRIYFLPQPDAADSLTLMAGEIITDPTTGQTTALPAKYEMIWISGALVKVWERLDPEHDTSKWENFFLRGLEKIRRDANSSPNESEILLSHRPGSTDFVHGASFPADFDISP